MATSGPTRARRSEVQPTDSVTGAGLVTEVDLWVERVDQRGDRAALTALLDEVELDRSARFRFERDRARFVARRAFLRGVLSGYLGVRPGAIRYRLSEHRRPELDPVHGLTFSTSHSAGLAVVAVTRDRRVGVDLERTREVPDVLRLAAGVCTPAELDGLRLVDPGRQAEAFLRIWVRKEAYLKALGTGLAVAMDEVHVGDTAGGRPLRDAHGPFAIASLDGLPGFVGAIAAAGARLDIRRIEALAEAS
jgi:4'-phosphopantetheinyl transferase